MQDCSQNINKLFNRTHYILSTYHLLMTFSFLLEIKEMLKRYHNNVASVDWMTLENCISPKAGYNDDTSE